MPARAIDFDTVKQLARKIGDFEEHSARGAPAIKAGGKLWAWMPVKKEVEPGTLAVRVDLAERTEMIAAAPDIYYFTDHYRDYPAVLVRLSRIHPDGLLDLLRMSHAFVTAKPARRKTLPEARRSKSSGSGEGRR